MKSAMTSRLISIRVVALAFVTFFIGMQFKSLKSLFRDNYSDQPGKEYLAWAPDNLHLMRGTKAKARKEESEMTNDGDEEENEDAENPVEEDVPKRKTKVPARFTAMNYTVDFPALPWSLPEPSPILYQTSKEFMSDYIAAKRKANINLPWEQPQEDEDAIKIPTPIVSLNFPKSATLTMRQFFKCGGLTSIHTSTQQGRIGVCMMENTLAGNPPMQNCDTHKFKGEIVKPIDFISDIGLQGPPCYYASLHDGGLEAIAEHYPDATILLVTRNANNWHRSISKWGVLLKRWKSVCGFDGSIHGDSVKYWNNMHKSASKEEYWVNFYHAHTQKIREFAMKHLSLTYVEVELEDEQMGDSLEFYTGVPASCVMDCHPGPKWMRQTNNTSRCTPALKTEEAIANAKVASKRSDDDDDDNVAVEKR
jgi:hypothetical protein